MKRSDPLPKYVCRCREDAPKPVHGAILSLLRVTDEIHHVINSGGEIKRTLAGQSGVRFGQHPTPRGPHAEIPHD
jgi:hypothetical protein